MLYWWLFLCAVSKDTIKERSSCSCCYEYNKDKLKQNFCMIKLSNCASIHSNFYCASTWTGWMGWTKNSKFSKNLLHEPQIRSKSRPSTVLRLSLIHLVVYFSLKKIIDDRFEEPCRWRQIQNRPVLFYIFLLLLTYEDPLAVMNPVLYPYRVLLGVWHRFHVRVRCRRRKA